MKIWVFVLCFDPPKTGNYARVMHDFFGFFKSHAKNAKKVPKSVDFGTILVEISGIEPLAS